MRLSLLELRLMIREEVDRLVRRSAGFVGGLGISKKPQDHSEVPPVGLGEEGINDEEQEESNERKIGR